MSAPVRSRPGVALVWLPDLLPLAVAAFSVPTVVLLIAGQFHAWLVLPIGLAAATAAVLVVGPERRAVPRLDVTWSVLALGLVAVSVLANAALSSQDIVVTRDPGTYATTAQWLADHSSLPIPTARSVFEGTPGLSDASLGFQTTEGGGAVDPQGNHLTQALVALVGAVLGPSALLKANAVIGGIALLSFFGLARRFAGGGWALLVTMALAPVPLTTSESLTAILPSRNSPNGLASSRRAKGRSVGSVVLKCGWIVVLVTLSLCVLPSTYGTYEPMFRYCPPHVIWPPVCTLGTVLFQVMLPATDIVSPLPIKNRLLFCTNSAPPTASLEPRMPTTTPTPSVYRSPVNV